MTSETKAEREKREAAHMANLDGVGRQYRQKAGLPERTSTAPFDHSDPDNVPELDKPSGPEGGYGGEELQPDPEEREEASSPGDPATLHEVEVGRGQAIASGQVDEEGELIEPNILEADESDEPVN